MKIFLSLIILFIAKISLPQITKKDSIPRIPFDTNKIKETVRLSNTSEVFSYDSLYIWSDKRSLSEIMDQRGGYFSNNFGLGGRNVINHNGFSEKDIGIFRDGIQINDILFGGFDIQNLSVNEIDKIEEISNVSSFLYGLNSSGKTINIITKDIFQSKPFSQLRYSQDRYNSLYADVFFTLPFSKKINWMIGATKHSIDGRYNNSEFDVWRGRSRLSFYPSPNLNLKLNFYYDNIKRGLNEGLSFNPNEDSLSSSNAPVLNSTTNENIENYYYDATVTAKLFKNKNALTKLKLYSINAVREFIDPDSSNMFPFLIGSKTFHYIQYRIDLKQNLIFKFNRNFLTNLVFGANAYSNYYNTYTDYSRVILTFKADMIYKNFLISIFGNNQNRTDKISFGFNKGIEVKYKLNIDKSNSVNLYAGINQTIENYFSYNAVFNNLKKIYYEIGGDFSLMKILNLRVNYYENKLKEGLISDVGIVDYDFNGINSSMYLNIKHFDVNIHYDYLTSRIGPKNFLRSDISYHDLLFNNNLNLRIGVNFKYFVKTNDEFAYNQSIYNYFFKGILLKKERFNMDFYIGARIGHANINVTIANIFNNFYYDTYLYPLDNRGGLLNAISRFTIVWDFIN